PSLWPSQGYCSDISGMNELVVLMMDWNVNLNRYRGTLLNYRERFERRYEETAKRHGLNRMHLLILPFALASGLSLYFMQSSGAYFYAALIVGMFLCLLDFVVEYSGIVRKEWNYPYPTLRIFRVPIEMPLMSFMCGTILTFIYYSFGNPAFREFMLGDPFFGVSLTQLVLVGMGGVFFVKYFSRKKNGSLILWALPWAIALYLEFPEPWLLAVAVLPVYLDYFLEKNLVKRESINYTGYDHEMAVNVAVSYFPVALLSLGLAALLLRILNGGF
ncbi:MAG: hypothetical protein KAU14_07065, partial [Thermoplasmata archaeon]|nr:hypothetical protein [Thermoplasmata archaeon]